MSDTGTHEKRIPGESAEYRAARNALLYEEQELRKKIEQVAAARRALPPGGLLKEDYEFEELNLPHGSTSSVRFSELFRDKDDLIVYSYMFGPDWKNPCASCTSVIDGIDVSSRHVRHQVEMVVIGKATPEQLFDIARERGWNDVRLLSSVNNDYARDYHAQPGDDTDSLLPIMNVFQRDSCEIRHFWASELLWTPMPGAHPRHVDSIWPLWNLLDMTRSGRDADWLPKVRY